MAQSQTHRPLKIEETSLLVPPLQDVAKVLLRGLTSYFETASVEVVDCPDLSAPPFYLAAPGLNGSPRVVEVGGISHFIPLYQPDKVYDLKDFPSLLKVEPAAVIGTGVAPFLHGHQSCVLLANAYVSKSGVKSLNQQAKITDENEKGYVLEFLPKNETKFFLMANLFVSEGKPGKVLKIHCKKRLKDDDFPAAVRKCLAQEYEGRHLGLGGVFVVEGSKVRHHIPPIKFSSEPIKTPEQLNSWLKFFDMDPPLTFVGTIVTDNMGTDMILQHFHSFSQHGAGGHYHYDTSPATVAYTAYFNLAERAVHVDRPSRATDVCYDNITPDKVSSGTTQA